MPEPTKVEPIQADKKNSPISVPSEEESTIMLDTAKKVCVWNDREFADGERVCTAGDVYECSFGKWVKVNASC